jgi:hypothetical protein
MLFAVDTDDAIQKPGLDRLARRHARKGDRDQQCQSQLSA